MARTMKRPERIGSTYELEFDRWRAFFLHPFLMHTAWRVVHFNELQLRVFNEVHWAKNGMNWTEHKKKSIHNGCWDEQRKISCNSITVIEIHLFGRKKRFQIIPSHPLRLASALSPHKNISISDTAWLILLLNEKKKQLHRNRENLEPNGYT